jgi:hypothetical protein
LKWRRFSFLVDATHTKPVHNFLPLQERLSFTHLIFAATLRASAVTYLLLGLSDFPTANDCNIASSSSPLHPAQRIATMIGAPARAMMLAAYLTLSSGIDADSAAGIDADPESGSMIGIPGHTAVEWLASLGVGLTSTVRSYRALPARPRHHAPSGEAMLHQSLLGIGERSR